MREKKSESGRQSERERVRERKSESGRQSEREE